MKSTPKRWITLVVVAGLVLAIDQLAKWWVVNNLDLYESWEPIPALMPFFRVTRSFNTGAAFGMFPMGSTVFLVLAVVAVVLFTYMYHTAMEEETLFAMISIPMIIGGAVGNAIDRVRFDHVVDFFHIQVGNFANISNFADHFITVGVILLLIDQYQQEMREKKRELDTPSLPLTPAYEEASQPEEFDS